MCHGVLVEEANSVLQLKTEECVCLPVFISRCCDLCEVIHCGKMQRKEEIIDC